MDAEYTCAWVGAHQNCANILIKALEKSIVIIKTPTFVSECGSNTTAVTSSVWPLSSTITADVTALYILTVEAHAAKMC